MLKHLLAILFCSTLSFGADTFITAPYLQLGASTNDATKLSLMWHTPDTPEAGAKFEVRVKPAGGTKWVPAESVDHRRIAVREIEPHLVYTAELKGLKPGLEFDYEVLRAGEVVFASRGLARKTAAQSYKFVVFGDSGQNNAPQKAVAKQVNLLMPDFVQVTGDIVYSRGRISEYREKHFPIYNSEAVPLLRRRPMIGVVGNHDTATSDLTKYPDALAYYYYWTQPLNGPDVEAAGQPRRFEGDAADIQAVRDGAGDSLKRMGSFSFDYGNAHWVALDMNAYLDWSAPKLREWLERDLKAAQSATWRFVTMHQPAFNSSKAHFKEQHPRWVADLMEKYHVDLVFAGHVHNYQRTYPLTFKVAADAPKLGLVPGEFQFDREFDGVSKTKAKSPIYIVTGAGGAGLYDPAQGDEQASWQSYTTKFVSNVNSFSWIEVTGKKLDFKQLDATGREVDRFTLTK